jgi:hypothetical protein
MFNILPLHMYAWSYTYWISLCIVTVRIWFFLIMSFMSQKSKVTFTLNKYTKFLFVYEWLKSLWFSNGYALNIARLVNLREHRLYRMKSHDFYVFMRTLILFDYMDIFPKEIRDTLTEINHFFRDKGYRFEKWRWNCWYTCNFIKIN